MAASHIRYWSDELARRGEIPLEVGMIHRAAEHALLFLADAVETMQRRERFEPESYL